MAKTICDHQFSNTIKLAWHVHVTLRASSGLSPSPRFSTHLNFFKRQNEVKKWFQCNFISCCVNFTRIGNTSNQFHRTSSASATTLSALHRRPYSVQFLRNWGVNETANNSYTDNNIVYRSYFSICMIWRLVCALTSKKQFECILPKHCFSYKMVIILNEWILLATAACLPSRSAEPSLPKGARDFLQIISRVTADPVQKRVKLLQLFHGVATSNDPAQRRVKVPFKVNRLEKLRKNNSSNNNHNINERRHLFDLAVYSPG